MSRWVAREDDTNKGQSCLLPQLAQVCVLRYLSEAAGAHSAGMQGKADLLEHVGVGGDPAQAHARGQKLAEAV